MLKQQWKAVQIFRKTPQIYLFLYNSMLFRYIFIYLCLIVHKKKEELCMIRSSQRKYWIFIIHQKEEYKTNKLCSKNSVKTLTCFHIYIYDAFFFFCYKFLFLLCEFPMPNLSIQTSLTKKNVYFQFQLHYLRNFMNNWYWKKCKGKRKTEFKKKNYDKSLLMHVKSSVPWKTIILY